VTRGRFLFVTSDAGGNVAPTLALARGLVGRGHAVGIISQGSLRPAAERSGCAFRALRSELDWDTMKARAIEDDMSFFSALCGGFEVAEDVVTELERDPTDLVVVDCMLSHALPAAEASGSPTAGLFHLALRSFVESPDPSGWEEEFELLNATRSRLGLPMLPRERPLTELWRRPARVLALVPREFDYPVPEGLANVRHVGPVFDEDVGGEWDLPFPRSDPEPLVLITFSSTYMHHEKVLERVAEAVASLPVRSVLSLAGALEPDEIQVPDGIEVRDRVSFPAVLPRTALVVSHGGLTTVMASLAHGVPMVCLPLGREQPLNAERVVACGAGLTLSAEATTDDIRASILDVLESGSYRRAAHRMGKIIAGYGNGTLALDELEGLPATT
jgi:MGT family glycosyltransferase